MALSVGDLAPSIDLPDSTGGRWKLEAFRGRPVVLIFHRHLA